ncbi:MAG: radical SAM protein [Candidatus Micrarchaeota archaeon]
MDPQVDRIIERRLPSRVDILSAPVRAYFEITQRCNLRCRHCYVGSTKSSYDGMETSRVLRVLDELHDCGVIDVRFTGGEPTMRKDWIEILKYARRLGFAISFNTNGMYRHPGMIAKELAKISPEQVTLSLDGLEANHDFIRGRGAFRRLMISARILSDAGIRLRFNTILNKKNVREVPQIIELASGLVTEINFFYFRPVGRGVDLQPLSLDFYEHFSSAMEAIGLRSRYPGLTIMHFEQSFTERSIFNFGALENIKNALPYGNTTVGITCDGGVWPHGYTPYQDGRFRLGNIPEERLSRIWTESEKLDSIRAWFRELIARCRRCAEYTKRCAGLNFEMEIAKLNGDIQKNNFCISQETVPSLDRILDSK